MERKTTSRRMNQDPSSSPPAQKFDNCAFDSPFPSLPSDLPYPYPVLPAIFLGSGDVSTCRLNAGQSQLISRRLQFMCTVCVGAPLESRRCPGPMGVRLYIHSCSAPFYGRTLTAVAFRSSFRSASSMMHQTARRVDRLHPSLSPLPPSLLQPACLLCLWSPPPPFRLCIRLDWSTYCCDARWRAQVSSSISRVTNFSVLSLPLPSFYLLPIYPIPTCLNRQL